MTKDLFIERDAVLSECRWYRYLLRRAWDHDRPRALFIMLNPSTADAETDDPTTRSCTRLCRAWEYGSFEIVNIYGWRASDPKELSKAIDPVGPENDHVIKAAISRCDTAICAWGAHPIELHRRDAVLRLIQRKEPLAYCLGRTKDGHPRHPLYIKTGTPLERYCFGSDEERIDSPVWLR